MSTFLTLITDNLKQGSLAIYDSELVDIINGNSNHIPITNINLLDNSSNKFRPIKCSELFNKLKSKSWFNYGHKYVSTSVKDGIPTEDNFVIRHNISATKYDISTSEIPIITTDVIKSRENDKDLFMGGFKVSGATLTNEDEGVIKEVCSQLFGSMNEVKDIYFYRSSKNALNLLDCDKYATFNIIRQDSDIYVNSLNLNNIIKHAVKENLYGKVSLTVQYSVGTYIYSKDVNFTSFTYTVDDSTNKVVLNIPNLIEDINTDIQLEYFNGEIRLFPLKEDISEYIISNCTITYGC